MMWMNWSEREMKSSSWLDEIGCEWSVERRRQRLGEGICTLSGGADVLEFDQLGTNEFAEIVITDV